MLVCWLFMYLVIVKQMEDGVDQNNRLMNRSDLGEKLLLAIKANNFPEVKSLINQRADVNYRNEDTSVVWQSLEIDDQHNRPKLDVKSLFPFSFPIMGNLYTTDYLIQNNANINDQDVNGQTYLHKAVEKSNVGVTQLLINYFQVGVNFQDINGKTALQRLVPSYNFDQHKNLGLDELLQIAHQHPLTDQQCKILALLVKNQVNIDAFRSSFLHQAVEAQDVKQVELLIKLGVFVDRFDNNGDTPLHKLFAPHYDSDKSQEEITQIADQPLTDQQCKILELFVKNKANILETNNKHQDILSVLQLRHDVLKQKHQKTEEEQKQQELFKSLISLALNPQGNENIENSGLDHQGQGSVSHVVLNNEGEHVDPPLLGELTISDENSGSVS